MACLWILCLIPIFLWLISPSLTPRFSDYNRTLQNFGQLSALVGTAMFALILFLSARLKWFENYFEGLNSVYERHNQLGQFALILLMLHPLLLLSVYAGSINDAAVFLLPGEYWPRNWGIFALGIMIILIVLTLYLKPRYDIWKWTHKFLGLAFFLAGLHVWMVPSDISRFLPLRIYMLALIGIALIAFTYRTLLGRYLIRKLTTPLQVSVHLTIRLWKSL